MGFFGHQVSLHYAPFKNFRPATYNRHIALWGLRLPQCAWGGQRAGRLQLVPPSSNMTRDVTVAANHENDTWHMFSGWACDGYSWLHIYADLDKIPKKSFTRHFGPLPDTLQAGACNFPSPVPTCGSIWVVLFGYPCNTMLLGQC